MENIIYAFLAGIFGGEIARHLANKDIEIKIPFFLVYALMFTSVYTVFFIFFLFVYFLKGFSIPWFGLGITSLSVALSVASILWLVGRLRK